MSGIFRLIALLASVAMATAAESWELPPIDYHAPTEDDAVAALRRRLAAGSARLERDPRRGLLPALLRELGVPIESQVLVFSKTSLQARRIGPATPRAMYFADDVYVGWVPGSELIEISSVSPTRGALFHTLDLGKALFLRPRHDCLQCHASALTGGIPGHLVRSVHPDPEGFPILRAGTFLTTHASPLADRWGGWYVTGRLGGQAHLGNAVAADRDAEPPPARADDLADVAGRIDAGPYLTAHSDVVALLVLEHQVEGHNLLARLSYEARQALHDDAAIAQAMGRAPGERSPTTLRRIDGAVERVVRHLLFADEAALTAPVAGGSGFAERFAARSPRDAQGRSLRSFDLRTRLFRWRCSYLVYDPTIDALPEPARARLWARLGEALARDADPASARLPAEERRAIREIVAGTRAVPW